MVINFVNRYFLTYELYLLIGLIIIYAYDFEGEFKNIDQIAT